jgi:hypothetical protein
MEAPLQHQLARHLILSKLVLPFFFPPSSDSHRVEARFSVNIKFSVGLFHWCIHYCIGLSHMRLTITFLYHLYFGFRV